MIIAVLSMLVALFLGYGALQEFLVLGLGAGLFQPLLAGVVGMLVCLLLFVSGVASWRHWATAPRLKLSAALAMVVFHVYAALPPHRNVGIFALLIGAGYGLFLLVSVLRSKDRQLRAV
jgi:hypothetical protein